MKKSIFIAYLILAILISGCTEPKTQSQSEATNAVDIKDFAFVPDSISVTKGTTVTWTNKDSTSHTVSAINKKFNSGTLDQGKTFSYTFNEAGTFEYECGIHPSMKGKVFVT